MKVIPTLSLSKTTTTMKFITGMEKIAQLMKWDQALPGLCNLVVSYQSNQTITSKSNFMRVTLSCHISKKWVVYHIFLEVLNQDLEMSLDQKNSTQDFFNAKEIDTLESLKSQSKPTASTKVTSSFLIKMTKSTFGQEKIAMLERK